MDGTFVAVGYSNRGTIFTSQDGLRWTTDCQGLRIRSMERYGKDSFVGCRFEGTMITSHDGKKWGKRASEYTSNLYAVAFGNETLLPWAMRWPLTSRDSVTWHKTLGVRNGSKNI